MTGVQTCALPISYLVIAKLSDVTFRIQEKPKSKPKVVHYDKLKVYTGPQRKAWKVEQRRKHPTEEEKTDWEDTTREIDPPGNDPRDTELSTEDSTDSEVQESPANKATADDNSSEIWATSPINHTELQPTSRADRTVTPSKGEAGRAAENNSGVGGQQRRYPQRQRRQPAGLKDYEIYGLRSDQ